MRHLFFLVLLAVGIGGPYLWYQGGDVVDKIKAQLSSGNEEPKQAVADWDNGDEAPRLIGAPTFDPENPEGPVSVYHSLEDVLRFDVSPDWIVTRWPRVSAGLNAEGLQTYRVPLVTGLDEESLAGSLTYHFDGEEQLRKITFRGSTGRPQGLINYVAKKFNLTRMKSESANTFVYGRNRSGRETGRMEVQPVSVLRQQDPLRRFQVTLDLPANESFMKDGGISWLN